MTSNDEMKLCVTLEALRWRITKTGNKSTRNEILYSYQIFDLLGCNNNEDIILQLLNKSRKVLQYTIYLINAMASEVVG
jgi:hypothetical protein